MKREYGRNRPMERHKYVEATCARFWSYVDRKGPSECWLWTGCLLKPNPCGMVYGMFGVTKGSGRTYTYRAHRFAWMLCNGEIPEGFVIMHTCDVPLCCNPAHLKAGTQRDNIQDQIDKGRWLCGEKAGRAVLTADQVRMMRASDLPDGYFAEQFGVHATTIRNARSGKKWASLQ